MAFPLKDDPPLARAAMAGIWWCWSRCDQPILAARGLLPV